MEAGSDLHVTRIDLYHTLDTLYKKGVLDDRHILSLDLYFTKCIGLRNIPDVETLLSFALKQLAEHSGYTDEVFIKRALSKYPKWSTIKNALVQNVEKLGDTFELA